ncbi:LWR-salt protein [Natronobacterium gregoryi]|uniref:LWR-salt protein n=2 Tax=Natronobacterium gregoryi TaxID=44930 RepID=L0AKJ8_NATGS|nr:LWR-salt protein [Natronobacterium gregoryi]AFZ74326.1 hypothetical protein Natgr_3196 [Natronobacterium gregoryi SP2]ELY63559.1 hypothetical protein C490_16114 [Natronobacterium gregoryi SP2]PLK22164.1 hypothetical protein CYV19_00355 [Natronobacterium gregoryi SP2]SFI53781.1 hypothetical protein SAMN05443661_101215 [Natronobacterium gregoryi]
MQAHYAFRVTIRLESTTPSVSIDPATAETTVTVYRQAPEPETKGWLFFRNALWRGEVADHEHARGLAEEWLGDGFEVESVAFSELRTDEAYLEAFEDAIAADLGAFKASTVSEVRSKYLGSSIRVVDG